MDPATFKKACPFLIEPADAPGWALADTVFVREMNAPDSDHYEAERMHITFDADGTPSGEPRLTNIRARLLVKCLCDVEGNRLFSDDQAVDLGLSIGRNLADRLFDQATRINCLNEKKDAKKNAEAPAGGSRTASPSPSGNGT